MAAIIRDPNPAVETFVVKRLKLPYNIECKGCNSVIAKGVKINAVQRIPEADHSTEGLKREHVITCAYCGHEIVMETAKPYSRGIQRTDNLLAEVDEEAAGGRDIFKGFAPGWREDRFKYASSQIALLNWPPKVKVDKV